MKRESDLEDVKGYMHASGVNKACVENFFVIMPLKDFLANFQETSRAIRTYDLKLIACLHLIPDEGNYSLKEQGKRKETIFFLQLHDIHEEIGNNKFCGDVIVVSKDFLESMPTTTLNFVKTLFHNQQGGINQFQMSPKTSHELATLLKAMKIELKKFNQNVLQKDFLASLLTTFLITTIRDCYIHNGIDILKSDKDYVLYEKFMDLVEVNFHKYHEVKDYASQLSISLTPLSNAIRKYNKHPASRIIKDRIITEAKRLLKHSTMKVKEISFNLGFNDPSYFNKFFKREVGVSPADFREID